MKRGEVITICCHFVSAWVPVSGACEVMEIADNNDDRAVDVRRFIPGTFQQDP
jgi:hypothetical protein